MKELISWLFSTPTPIIAIISAIIALLAYSHQRKGMRKQNACKVADRYAKELLPRMRYIHKILELSGLTKITNKFVGFKFFTEKELNELLLNAESTEKEFHEKLESVTKEMLEQAFAASGCNPFIYQHHQALLSVADNPPNLLGDAVSKFIVDFLNDMESMAILLHYNVAEEKLIYQSLHQTLLRHMKSWYFFVSDQNRNDQDRFFTNLIWLYNTWVKRKKADENSIDTILWLRAKAKKL